MLYLEGRNVVLEALRAGRPLAEVILYSGVREDAKISEILKLASRAQVPVRRLKRKELQKISQTGVPQGVIALTWKAGPTNLTEVLEKFRAASPPPFILVLPEVQNEQNLGAILRSAEGAGVAVVLLPPRSRGVTPVVARTSMGASEYLPVVQANIFSSLRQLRDEGFLVVGADATGKLNYWQVDLTGPVALVVGGEDRGLTEPLQKACEAVVSIPLQGQLNSLNIGVSAAILMFERVRQLREVD